MASHTPVMAKPVRWEAHRGREVLVWGLLLVASAPVLIDTVGHLLVTPWAAGCLVFWALFVREVVRTPTRYTPLRSGWLLVALGLALELLMVRADWTRWARPGVAMAMVGMAMGIGHPRIRMALLALWTVPLPTFVASIANPHLERLYLRLAEALLGASFTLTDAIHGVTVVDAGAYRMDFFPEDGGLHLAFLLAGLGYFTATREGLAPVPMLRRAALYALLAFPIQGVAVVATCAVMLAGWPEAARLGLGLAPWMLSSAFVLIRQR